MGASHTAGAPLGPWEQLRINHSTQEDISLIDLISTSIGAHFNHFYFKDHLRYIAASSMTKPKCTTMDTNKPFFFFFFFCTLA